VATPRPPLSSYPNHQSASLLWYHDHADQTTRLNVYAGLVGLYIIRDALDTGAEPNGLGVPGGGYEIPLLLSDKLFDAAGDLFYSPDPTWIAEFFGDTPVASAPSSSWPRRSSSSPRSSSPRSGAAHSPGLRRVNAR